MSKLFKNTKDQATIEKDGCVALNLLSKQDVSRLLNLIEELKVKDANSYTVADETKSISSKDLKARREAIARLVKPALTQVLKDFKIVSADFMIKEPNNKAFIPPHQDSSLSDEEEGVSQTVYCWIPLIQTDIYNGAIGAVKGSHHVLKGSSPPFPNPRAPRFLDNQVFDLFPYMSVFSLHAGAAFFFLNKVLHGSLPNYSQENRSAIRLGLIPEQAQMVSYILKPQSNLKVVQKYRTDPSFNDNYPNKRLLHLYDENKELNSFELLEELAYKVPELSLEKFLDELNKKGFEIEKNPLISRMINESYIPQKKAPLLRKLLKAISAQFLKK